jgi:glutathione S-transferase
MPNDLTLYFSPGACSLAVHIALEEAGVKFAAHRVAIAEGAHRSPAFLAINPRGRVPAMVVDGRVVTEVQALLQLASDLSDGAMMPEGPAERAQVREWLAYQSGTIHLGFAQFWRPERFSGDPAAHKAIVAGARGQFPGLFAGIDAALHRGWIVGQRFSLADLLPFVFFRWARRVGTEMAGYPAWCEHTRHLLERDAVRRALCRETLDPAEWLEAGG